MDILVAVAGKHGSTLEIAEAIGEELRKTGHTVTVFDLKHSPAVEAYDVTTFDAVIIGSAVYAGSWVGEAQHFIDAHQIALRARPVWLFSSGPLGAEKPEPSGEPAQVPDLMSKSGAREHEVFVGKLDRDRLNWGEKLIVKVVRAPYGDFRDWDAIRAWAREIASELESDTAPA